MFLYYFVCRFNLFPVTNKMFIYRSTLMQGSLSLVTLISVLLEGWNAS
jgi:hypothetical protein